MARNINYFYMVVIIINVMIVAIMANCRCKMEAATFNGIYLGLFLQVVCFHSKQKKPFANRYQRNLTCNSKFNKKKTVVPNDTSEEDCSLGINDKAKYYIWIWLSVFVQCLRCLIFPNETYPHLNIQCLCKILLSYITKK